HLQRKRGLLVRLLGNNGNSLRSMTRSFEEPKRDGTHLQLVAVFHFPSREFCVRPLAIDDLRTGTSGELDVAADKIGVRMRFDHILDHLAVRFCFVDVLLYITLRIYNNGFILRTEIVRGVRKTPEIELLKVHELTLSLIFDDKSLLL